MKCLTYFLRGNVLKNICKLETSLNSCVISAKKTQFRHLSSQGEERRILITGE